MQILTEIRNQLSTVERSIDEHDKVLLMVLKILEACLKDDPNNVRWMDDYFDIDEAYQMLNESREKLLMGEW